MNIIKLNKEKLVFNKSFLTTIQKDLVSGQMLKNHILVFGTSGAGKIFFKKKIFNNKNYKWNN